jgi:GMP synthase-like glutamine amidotransferase
MTTPALRIHCLQHVPFEGPAAIEERARARGHGFATTRLDRAEPLPAIADFDWLVVMGGPMGVADRDRFDWMAPEIALIRGAVDAGRRVLGVCLGAQFLAHALGADVRPAAEREIGWFPVEGLAPADAGIFDGLPPTFTPLHWHGDTFELPPGAVQLARGPACEHQAFQLGPRAIGLQFHLEATPTSVTALVDHCADEIGPGRWQMAPQSIRDCEARCAATRPILEHVLQWLARAGEAGDPPPPRHG